jgi:hypothetical protein
MNICVATPYSNLNKTSCSTEHESMSRENRNVNRSLCLGGASEVK